MDFHGFKINVYLFICKSNGAQILLRIRYGTIFATFP